MKIIQSIPPVIERLSRADIVFWTMPALIILLVVGTVTQADMGLYAAHQKYFSSFFFFEQIGPMPIPLPGGYILIGIITINLTLKFLFHSEWALKKAGIILTHMGALILLIGGLLTAVLAKESFMVIPEGESTPFIYDYHARELVFFEDNQILYSLDFSDLHADKTYALSSTGLNIDVLATCDNCAIEKREDSPQDFGDQPLHSMAQFMALKADAPDIQPEANISGLTFQLSGAAKEQNGIYIGFEGMPKPIELTIPSRYGSEERRIQAIFGKVQDMLPFSIKLINFVKETYPGLSMVKAFSSQIAVQDSGIEWPVLIEMNKPLRYKGYTFYQSSYEQGPDQEVTILSVVENKGRLFPYIGALVIAAGLILHLILLLFLPKKEKP